MKFMRINGTTLMRQYKPLINGQRYELFMSDVNMYQPGADCYRLLCDAASSAFGPGCIVVSDPLGMKMAAASFDLEPPRVFCYCYVLSEKLKVLSGEILLEVTPTFEFTK